MTLSAKGAAPEMASNDTVLDATLPVKHDGEWLSYDEYCRRLGLDPAELRKATVTKAFWNLLTKGHHNEL